MIRLFLYINPHCTHPFFSTQSSELSPIFFLTIPVIPSPPRSVTSQLQSHRARTRSPPRSVTSSLSRQQFRHSAVLKTSFASHSHLDRIHTPRTAPLASHYLQPLFIHQLGADLVTAATSTTRTPTHAHLSADRRSPPQTSGLFGFPPRSEPSLVFQADGSHPSHLSGALRSSCALLFETSWGAERWALRTSCISLGASPIPTQHHMHQDQDTFKHIRVSHPPSVRLPFRATCQCHVSLFVAFPPLFRILPLLICHPPALLSLLLTRWSAEREPLLVGSQISQNRQS
jgi:hypothetical protein